MKLDQLRAFVAVVEERSLTRAATRLQTSQSTVSFHLSSLEKSVGTRLVDRGRSGAAATPAGRQLLRDARGILAAVDEAGRKLSQAADLRGEVRVAASTIPATYLLPEVLGALRERAPELGVRLHVRDSRAALQALLQREVEMVVVGSRPRDRRVLSRECGQDSVVLVGRPNASVEALVLREEGSGTRSAVEDLIPDIATRIHVDSTEAVRRCVLAGLGHGFISDSAVAEDLAAGRLATVPLAGLPVRRSFHAARLRNVTLSPGARELWSLIG